MRGVGEEQYHDHEVKEQGVCAWVGASQSILGTRAPRRRSHVYKSWPTLNHSAWSTDHLTFSFCLTRKRSGPPPFSLLQFPKTRTHRTRVSPYSRDFLVPCWTPPPPHLLFLGLPFLDGATHHQCKRHTPTHYYYFTLTYDKIYKISLSKTHFARAGPQLTWPRSHPLAIHRTFFFFFLRISIHFFFFYE